LHGVVDRQARRDASARRVDVHVDVLIRVFFFQEQELSDHEVRQVIVDRTAYEDDSVFEQPRIDVVRTLSARALLDHHWNQMTHFALLQTFFKSVFSLPL
jgi:hypothetical protein